MSFPEENKRVQAESLHPGVSYEQVQEHTEFDCRGGG